MASIEEIKAALARSIEEGEEAIRGAQALGTQIEEAITILTAVAVGAGNPGLIEAIDQLRQAKESLGRVIPLIQGGNTKSREYSQIL